MTQRRLIHCFIDAFKVVVKDWEVGEAILCVVFFPIAIVYIFIRLMQEVKIE